MPTDLYTHVVNYEVNGQFVRGLMYVDAAGEVQLKITEFSQPIALHILTDFAAACVQAKMVWLKENKELTKIVIRKVGTP